MVYRIALQRKIAIQSIYLYHAMILIFGDDAWSGNINENDALSLRKDTASWV